MTTEAERLWIELATLESILWLIKDKTTALECTRAIEQVQSKRVERLEKLTKGVVP